MILSRLNSVNLLSEHFRVLLLLPRISGLYTKRMLLHLHVSRETPANRSAEHECSPTHHDHFATALYLPGKPSSELRGVIIYE